jgi:peptidoglycan/xylan/chitin deacetylase (PgdA/CDA1 family)
MLKDPRAPLYLLDTYRKKRLIIKLEEGGMLKGSKIYLMMTYDVEGYDKANQIESVKFFLKRAQKLLKKKNIKATFFIQGNLIEDLNKPLTRLEEDKHELGLHGYSHEPWGYDWFIRDEVPSINVRKKILKKSIAVFIKHGLRKPISFRAPHLVIDSTSLRLLEEFDFRIDSSAQSYKGIMPLISKVNNLLEVPVSVSPIPRINLRRYIPYIDYLAFNMENLAGKLREELLDYVSTIFAVQKLYDQPLHLVFLAHSWEFMEHPPTAKGYRYCSNENFKKIFDMIELIQRRFKAKFLTMKDFYAYVREG